MKIHSNPCVACGEEVEDGALFCPHCGEPIQYRAPEIDPFVGRTVSQRYQVVQRIARGGMGEVYLARHAELNQRVAVKFLHRRFADDEEFATRFFNEARSACRVNHPNAVTIYDFGRLDDGTLYIVMEFVEGISLKQMIEREGRLSPRAALRVAQQICEVLASAHSQAIIHRDVKPDNIMVMEPASGRLSIKVLDFGIAKILDDDSAGGALTQTGVTFGTPEYMSPEQASGRDTDARSDVYALGLVLYAMLVGQPPFRGKNKLALLQRHIREAPPTLDRACPESLPESLVKLVADALEKDPVQRPQSMTAMLARLEECERDLGDSREPARPKAAAPAEGRRAILTHSAPPKGERSGRMEVEAAPATGIYELGDDGPSFGREDFSLGRADDDGSDNDRYAFDGGPASRPDFDDDRYAAPLATGPHRHGRSKSAGRVWIYLLSGAMVVSAVAGANWALNRSATDVVEPQTVDEALAPADEQVELEGSAPEGSGAEALEGSGRPAPVDELRVRLDAILQALTEGRVQEAERLLVALEAESGEFQDVINTRNRLNAIRGIERQIEEAIAAGECAEAATQQAALARDFSRPLAESYGERVRACRAPAAASPPPPPPPTPPPAPVPPPTPAPAAAERAPAPPPTEVERPAPARPRTPTPSPVRPPRDL